MLFGLSSLNFCEDAFAKSFNKVGILLQLVKDYLRTRIYKLFILSIQLLLLKIPYILSKSNLLCQELSLDRGNNSHAHQFKTTLILKSSLPAKIWDGQSLLWCPWAYGIDSLSINIYFRAMGLNEKKKHRLLIYYLSTDMLQTCTFCNPYIYEC
jgi:hypothetical protein